MMSSPRPPLPPPPPAPPPPSARHLSSRDLNFIDGLFSDLTVRVEWLGQVIDSVPMKDRAIPALTTVRGYAKALADLRTAIERVQSHAQEPALATLFRLEGPLAAYLSRLYAWTEEISSELEALAVGLRRDEPVWTVFSHRAVTGSFEHFNDLSEAVRKKVASTTAPPGKLEPFSAHLEELFWATEWLHLSLAKAPGQ